MQRWGIVLQAGVDVKEEGGILQRSRRLAKCARLMLPSLNLPVQFEHGNLDIIDANFVSAVTDVVFEC